MVKLKNLTRTFLDYWLYPVIIVSLLTSIIIFVSSEFRINFPLTILIIEWIVGCIVAVAFLRWIGNLLKLNSPKGFRIILTLAYGLLTIPIYFVVGVVGLVIISMAPRYFYLVMYRVAATVAFTAGVTPVTKGIFSKIIDGFAKLILMNHASFIDYILVVLVMGYKQKWKVVIGKNLRKYWPFNQYIKKVGIFIERGNSGSEALTARQIMKALDEGYNVVIFPSGGRDRPNEIRDFELGPFIIAERKQTRIIPVAMHKTGTYCPAGPKSKNTTGELPKNLWKLIKYRYDATLDLVQLFLNGEADHLLILPTTIKLEVLPEISLMDLDNNKKQSETLRTETHNIIHETLGNK